MSIAYFDNGWYTANVMSYEVGTHILLTQPSSAESTASSLYEVGTQFVIQRINDKFKLARRIPVAFA